MNRRMLGVFIWCFIIPAAALAAGILLIKYQILPARSRALLDSVLLLFPLGYSILVLLREAILEARRRPKMGGLDPFLRQSLSDAQWREGTAEKLRRAVPADPQEWAWIASNFSQDVETMRYRTRFLTALSGTVLFLISQGIDLLDPPQEFPPMMEGRIFIRWLLSVTGEFTQMIGLALFLVLLYLSWSQTLRSLERFLGSIRLLVPEAEPVLPGKTVL